MAIVSVVQVRKNPTTSHQDPQVVYLPCLEGSRSSNRRDVCVAGVAGTVIVGCHSGAPKLKGHEGKIKKS